MDLNEIIKCFPFIEHSLETPQNTYSSHGTFLKIDHPLVYKTNFNRYEGIEKTSHSLSVHSGIQPDLNSCGNLRKHTVSWRSSSTLLNDVGLIEEIKKEIKKKIIEQK